MKFVMVCLALCLLICCIKAADGEQISVDESPNGIVVPSARSQFRLPKLFDFDTFKSMFGKSYSSLLEELAKKKLFLARAFAVFVSGLSYMRGNSSTYLSVNPMSDWTPEERAKLRFSPDKLPAERIVNDQIEVAKENQEIEQIELTIDQIETNKQPELKMLADEIKLLKGDKSRRKKRNVAIDSSLRKLKSLVKDYMSPKKEVDLEDMVFIDHRQSGCFNEIRHQGSCGSCYAFATIAYFEYLYCKQTGKKVQFSEQYIVDCMEPAKFGGCDGAITSDPVEFVHQFGLQPRDRYPYRTKKDTCPYDRKEAAKNWGKFRLKDGAKVKEVKQSKLLAKLKESPIVTSVKLNDKFADYGGGVDDNADCDIDNYHAMLLVGHGREDGKEYLLFRNSHSQFWGLNGHYKMNMKAMKGCLLSFPGVSSSAQFEADGINESFKESAKIIAQKLIDDKYAILL